MSGKTEDVEAVIETLSKAAAFPWGAYSSGGEFTRADVDDLRTLLASHAAQAEEIGRLEGHAEDQRRTMVLLAERIASLEEQLARVVPLLSDEDKMHPAGCSTWLLEASVASEEITDLLSGKASA